MRGHKLAQLDPLGLSSADLDAERPNDLTFKFYNFSKISIGRKPGGTGAGKRIDSRIAMIDGHRFFPLERISS